MKGNGRVAGPTVGLGLSMSELVRSTDPSVDDDGGNERLLSSNSSDLLNFSAEINVDLYLYLGS